MLFVYCYDSQQVSRNTLDKQYVPSYTFIYYIFKGVLEWILILRLYCSRMVYFLSFQQAVK